ncbi:MAG: hypothetical protein WD638_02270 [Nitriliruptoraceae bacterium]
MGRRMRADGARPEGPYEANWIAAYAMGLASAKRRVETCLRELVQAAEGEPQRLRQACDRLRELEQFDKDLREQAELLLTTCVERAARQDLVDDVLERLDALEDANGEERSTA